MQDFIHPDYCYLISFFTTFMKFVQEAHEHAFLGKKYIDDKFFYLKLTAIIKPSFFFFSLMISFSYFLRSFVDNKSCRSVWIFVRQVSLTF
jgi:hypothetical protein